MDILKRWLKLKKAQRVRNPWAVATALNQGKHTGNSGTSKGAYVAGINRNEWNSPEGMEAASERSAEYHGMSPKRKKGQEKLKESCQHMKSSPPTSSHIHPTHCRETS